MKNTIEINIHHYEDVIEKFDHDKLSKELAQFIYDESLLFPLREKTELVIRAEQPLMDQQKHDLVDMIRAYFGMEVKRLLIFSKHQQIRQLLVFLIGVFFIALTNLRWIIAVPTVHEILLITGWVSIWEFVHGIFFEDMKRKLKRKRCQNLSSAKIRVI